jgi:ABC-type transport system involved in multi-copper enzyme maturation permease subunit
VSETTKALFKDALFQVLDNKVFRLLVILGAVLVLPTFLIAAKPEELVVLFGWRTYEYGDVLGWFEIPMPADPAANHAALIQTAQTLLVDQLAGTFGLIFAIAATAFFVPRMVEKGAADTVFSKPVSRGALLLSRYVAGLLFVAILASVLVVGMHVGLMLNSGYSDAGFLWAIPVMIYKYGILHAFSLLVAVLTRSSVAAILTTLMFFAFNGCVHGGWQIKEQQQQQLQSRIAAGDEPEGDDPGDVVNALLVTLDVLHYTLPKTSDAAVISQSLRTALAERRTVFKDPESTLKVANNPEGMEPVAVGEADLPTIARWVDEAGTASVTLKRWSVAERKRPQALRELDQQLADMGIKDVEKDREHFLDRGADSRSWSEPRGERTVQRKTTFFTGKGWLFALEFELPAGWEDQDERRDMKWRFRGGFEIEGAARDAHQGFANRATWGGELKYNLWFSLGSTLAFVALILALAWWKLSRIDF